MSDCDDNAVLIFHLTEGYSLRMLLESMKNEIPDVCFIFSPTKIIISGTTPADKNPSYNIMHYAKMKSSDVPLYIYRIKDDEGNLLPEKRIILNSLEMVSRIKTIGKRDGIKIILFPNDNSVTIQIIKQSKGMDNNSEAYVNMISREIKIYAPEKKEMYGEPNIKISTKDFSTMCSQANSAKCSEVRFVCLKNGIDFFGYQADLTCALYEGYRPQDSVGPRTKDNKSFRGRKKDDDAIRQEYGDKLISIIHVPIVTIKSLSKCHNFASNTGFLRFYFNEDLPVLIEGALGSYASYFFSIVTSTPKKENN